MTTASPLPPAAALDVAQGFLQLFQTQVQVRYETPLPIGEGCLFVVGNHRSFLDAPLLMGALGQPVHIVCHYYLSQVPLINELIQQLGGVHLGQGGQGWGQLFRQTSQYLQQGEHMAIFPEGAARITRLGLADQPSEFSRGFVHLALRSAVTELPLVPVAIVSRREQSGPLFPLSLLQLFDNREPTFQRPGWHPYVLYERVLLMVGRPRRLTASEQYGYRHGNARQITAQLTEEFQTQTRILTARGYQERW
ncbi:1-acyl-sn-glycerol-3-phosphate acyltransferase [Candidatus Cyanaurora vandensis]|uniref:lysophospholipid acyltransferase family protein n=1 Tax=Candidatus Cyanaurora vandensis TaxID=2714958 RepID=UPI00257AF712|nr:1-acyl-sn-glycerol-3-phosphate acyltransferase [Candidatus Cyanaurora vandensis]